MFLALAILAAGFVIYPWVRSKNLRMTRMKVAALVIAVGIWIYLRSWPAGLIFAFPLSLIWFPEHWGNYTGFLQGAYIDEKTPPAVVVFAGWICLALFPLLLFLIGFR
jgi:hypothetical protein